MKLEAAHFIFLKAALQRRPRAYFRPGVNQAVLTLCILRSTTTWTTWTDTRQTYP